jgi:hypothetical protein
MHHPVKKCKVKNQLAEKIQLREIEKEPLKVAEKKCVGKLKSRKATRKVGSEQNIVIREKKMRKAKGESNYKK